MDENLKVCPYCKSEIPADAIKCKFCGEYVDEKMHKKLNSKPSILKYKGFQFAPNIFCPHCQYEGKAKLKTPGSTFTEILLWFFFIIPGLIYSSWRSKNKQRICPQCRNEELVEMK